MADRLSVDLSYIRGVGSDDADIDDNGNLTVTVYHFGEDVAYEYTDEITFSIDSQIALAVSLEHPQVAPSSQAPLDLIAQRSKGSSEVEKFSEEHKVPFRKQVDFQP